MERERMSGLLWEKYGNQMCSCLRSIGQENERRIWMSLPFRHCGPDR